LKSCIAADHDALRGPGVGPPRLCSCFTRTEAYRLGSCRLFPRPHMNAGRLMTRAADGLAGGARKIVAGTLASPAQAALVRLSEVGT
jgi:hypothetical protein